MSTQLPTERSEEEVEEEWQDRQSHLTSAHPPKGWDWGERTLQGFDPIGRSPQYYKSDAYEISQYFGLSTGLDVEAFTEKHRKRIVYPDLMIHEKEPERTISAKATDALIKGDRGSGKTTALRGFAYRLMDLNDEIVLWRGREESSGWLPFRKWTTLYLPTHADVQADWMNEDDEADASAVESADLDEVVREVVYYDDIRDLLEKLEARKQGTFNVIYPDPSFNGCEDLTRDTSRGQFSGALPFTPEWEVEDESDETPLIQWWFGFLLGRVEWGPYKWMTLLFDEAGDFVPMRAKQSQSRLYDKIGLLRSIWASSRKRYLSLFFAVHHEENMDDDIRREFHWRIHMPDESPNPVESRSSTHPIGFDTVPMFSDRMGWRDKACGIGLCYTQSGWTEFKIPYTENLPEDRDRWLRITLGEPIVKPKPRGERAENQAPELEFDENVFYEWQNQVAHRLYVLEGSGYVDVDGLAIEEELVSPFDDLDFVQELRPDGQYREVLMQRRDGKKVVVARIPDENAPSGAADEGGPIG